jgi:hypothetical protein
VHPIVEIVISFGVSIASVSLIAMGIVILRRTRRGEKAVSDEDWRLLFGKPKAEVLTAHYAMRLVLAIVACLVVGLVEYLVLFPYGVAWYGVGVVATAFAIILSHVKDVAVSVGAYIKSWRIEERRCPCCSFSVASTPASPSSGRRSSSPLNCLVPVHAIIAATGSPGSSSSVGDWRTA